MSDLVLARALAYKFHEGQKYGEYPYTYHLECVANSVSGGNFSGVDSLGVIAMLHDILEDTKCTTATLSALFDHHIVDAVVDLTKFGDESYEDYIATVKANPLAKKVKMHDTLCNLQESLVGGDMKRVVKYSKQMQLLAE